MEKRKGFNFVLETRSSYIAKDSFELAVLLRQLLECWDYTCEPSCPAQESLFLSLFSRVQTIVN